MNYTSLSPGVRGGQLLHRQQEEHRAVDRPRELRDVAPRHREPVVHRGVFCTSELCFIRFYHCEIRD